MTMNDAAKRKAAEILDDPIVSDCIFDSLYHNKDHKINRDKATKRITDILTTCAPPVTRIARCPKCRSKNISYLEQGIWVCREEKCQNRWHEKDMAPPVSHEVVEALKQAIEDIESQSADAKKIWKTTDDIKRENFSAGWVAHAEVAIRHLKEIQALADAGTCRCDCEKYRKLLLQCRDADDEGEAYDMILDFFDNEEKDAALGAEKEEK